MIVSCKPASTAISLASLIARERCHGGRLRQSAPSSRTMDGLGPKPSISNTVGIVRGRHIIRQVSLLEVILDILDATLVSIDVASARVHDAARTVPAFRACVSRHL